MHELSIAQSIVDIVREEAARNGVEQLSAVNIAMGKMTAVVPQQLAFCFDMLIMDTNLAGATLNIREVPIGYTYPTCGEKFSSDDILVDCPRFGEKNPKLTSGMELNIESIETAD